MQGNCAHLGESKLVSTQSLVAGQYLTRRSPANDIQLTVQRYKREKEEWTVSKGATGNIGMRFQSLSSCSRNRFSVACLSHLQHYMLDTACQGSKSLCTTSATLRSRISLTLFLEGRTQTRESNSEFTPRVSNVDCKLLVVSRLQRENKKSWTLPGMQQILNSRERQTTT